MSEKKKFIGETTTIQSSMNTLRREVGSGIRLLNSNKLSAEDKKRILLRLMENWEAYNALDLKIASRIAELKKHYLGDEFAEWYEEYYGFPYKNESHE